MKKPQPRVGISDDTGSVSGGFSGCFGVLLAIALVIGVIIGVVALGASLADVGK